MHDVVPNQLEILFVQQVGDVGLLTGEEIVNANHVVTFVNQSFAEVRAQKPCAAGNQNSLNCHFFPFSMLGRLYGVTKLPLISYF